jgi:hypothetical protein
MRLRIRPTNISNRHSNRHFATQKIESIKNESPSTNKTEVSKMNYSKMKKDELKALCKERKIKGITGKSKEELIEMITQRDATPVSAPKIEAKTDVKATAPVKVEMNWIPWSEKSNDIPFKSTITGVGDGEQKMERELNTPLLGQNSSYDMMPILNGTKTKCDVKKLDLQNDFNTGKEGRDALRPSKLLHTILIDSLIVFQKSDLFTSEEKAKLVSLQDISPDEISVGTLKKMKDVCMMLNVKKKTLSSGLPTIPFTTHGQTKDIPIDLYYTICQKVEAFHFPSEFTSYIETIQILQKMDHIYIDEPSKFMEDLNALVGKLFTDIKLILVNKDKGYLILPDANRIRFYRITRGHPRFQVIF